MHIKNIRSGFARVGIGTLLLMVLTAQAPVAYAQTSLFSSVIDMSWFQALFGSTATQPTVFLAEVPLSQALTGLQASDRGCSAQAGTIRYVGADDWSLWATDENSFDPDCFRVYVSSVLLSKDVQICWQFSDHGSTSNLGDIKCTPWASDGGGWSGWATDENSFDPDSARIMVNTRTLPEEMAITNARLGIQASDRGCTSQFGTIQYTPWASDGGGWSGWATDENSFDPDCFRIALEVETTMMDSGVDMCLNIDGLQTTVPSGYVLVSDNNCILGACVPGYVCQSNDRYFQDSQCSLSFIEECPYGCADGVCLPQVCTAGLVCVGDDVYQQTTACEKKLVEACDFSCSNGLCLSAGASITVSSTFVRAGDTVEISWTADGAVVNSCELTSGNGDSWTALSGTETTSPIYNQTVYTLICDDIEVDTVTVQTVPSTYES